MTRLIVIRHGYSVTNASRRYTGHMDVPLTELGLEQAQRVADYLTTHEHIDAVYASDLSRAVDTVAPTAKRLGLTVIPEAGLRELHMGLWEGRLFDEIKVEYREAFEHHRADVDAPCTGGESTRQAFDRVTRTVKRILEENEGKCVVIATHALPCRVIDCMANGAPCEAIREQPFHENASITIYDCENGCFTLKQMNLTTHLTGADSHTPKHLL
ncbi:MAG: histidine phosphatase family protein [Clostridia bacterium]|nr:histidine phosphatase family protein [Clostridia bacterium]